MMRSVSRLAGLRGNDARNRSPGRGVGGRMPNPRTLLALVSMLALAACSGSAGGVPDTTADPGGSPGAPASADTGGLTHPRGADEIVLRMEEGGGFVPAEFNATSMPVFTLYGDGTVVFQDATAVPPAPANGGATLHAPLRTAVLSEEQIQALLEFAITEGGLAVARERYDNQMVADAATSTFTIHAGGVEKTVQVYALGFDAEPGPDSNVKAALMKLAERLRSFDQGGALPSEPYQPERFRGALWEVGPGVAAPKPWPWADLTPSDFVTPDEPNAFGFPSHDLTDAQLQALGLGVPEGAVSGLTFTGPDGKVYGFALRPLLPEELE